jgi:hypothetical protein
MPATLVTPIVDLSEREPVLAVRQWCDAAGTGTVFPEQTIPGDEAGSHPRSYPMKKWCSVVVSAVAIIGLSATPASAATAQIPRVPTWLCQIVHICK